MSDVAVGSLTRRLGGSCDAVAINMLGVAEKGGVPSYSCCQLMMLPASPLHPLC